MGLDGPLAARCVSALVALLEREERLVLRRPPTWPTVKAALKASQLFTDLTRLHAALQPSEARRLLQCALSLHDAVNHWMSGQGDAGSELSLGQRHAWLRSRLELLTDIAATCHAQQARKEALSYLYKALDCHYGLLEFLLLDATPNHALLLARIEIARAHLHLGTVSTELHLMDAGAFHARTAAGVTFEVLLAAAQAPVVARRQRDEWAQLLGRALYDLSVHQEKHQETADALQACRKAYEITVASVGKQHPRAEALWKRLDTLAHVMSANKTNKGERGPVDADPWRAPSAWKSLLQSFGYAGGCDVPEKPAIPTKPPAAKKSAPTPRAPKTPTKPNVVDLTGCPTPRLLALSPVLHKDIIILDPSPTPNARRPQSATAWARPTASTSPLATPPKRPRPQTASSARCRTAPCPPPRIFSPVRSTIAKAPGHKTRLELAIADANGTKTVVALTILDTREAPPPDVVACVSDLVDAVLRHDAKAVCGDANATTQADEAVKCDTGNVATALDDTSSIATVMFEMLHEPPMLLPLEDTALSSESNPPQLDSAKGNLSQTTDVRSPPELELKTHVLHRILPPELEVPVGPNTLPSEPAEKSPQMMLSPLDGMQDPPPPFDTHFEPGDASTFLQDTQSSSCDSLGDDARLLQSFVAASAPRSVGNDDDAIRLCCLAIVDGLVASVVAFDATSG